MTSLSPVSNSGSRAEMLFDQDTFDLRCEWGARGVTALLALSDVVVIVDVLCFSTCVEVATARGAVVFPHGADPDAAARFASAMGADLALPRGEGRFSLSPQSFTEIAPATRIVLPSPNGGALSLATGTTPTLAGCLRNASAVAHAAHQFGQRVAVIPAGERWPDGSLRPALEDWIGAGAILDQLVGSRSPEAQAAVDAFHAARTALQSRLLRCVSGEELIACGYEDDVIIGAALDASDCTPVLTDGNYVR